jgi:hypothetical protein
VAFAFFMDFMKFAIDTVVLVLVGAAFADSLPTFANVNQEATSAAATMCARAGCERFTQSLFGTYVAVFRPRPWHTRTPLLSARIMAKVFCSLAATS